MNALISGLCIVALSAAAARAQTEEQEKVRQEQAEKERIREQHHQQQQGQQRGDDRGDPAAGTVESADGTTGAVQPVAASRDTLSNACSLQSMVSPRRLAAGESGTITLLLALQSRAVILQEATWVVTYKTTQGAGGQLTLGQWTVRPPGLGTLEEAFKGKPVYDNQALVDVPVTVAGGTPNGKQMFEADVEVALTDGATGRPLGQFRSHATLAIDIGAPMPRPVVLGARAARTGAAQPSSGGPADTIGDGSARAPAVPAGSEVKQLPTAGAGTTPPAAHPAGAAGPERTGAQLGDVVEESASGSLPILPIGLGAGALLALVLVLSMRKK